MVALHNRRLTYRDVFPDNPWEWETHNQWRRDAERKRREAGEDELRVLMGAAEDVRKRHADMPTMKQMQSAFRRIYPPAKMATQTTGELVAALEAIRDGHNDPRKLANDVLSALSNSKPTD